MSFVGTHIVNLFVSLSKWFADYLTRLIAQNDPNLISDYIASLMIIAFCWAMLDIFVAPLDRVKQAEKDIIELEQRIKGGESDVRKDEESIESRIVELKMMIRKRKVISKLMLIIGVFLFFFFSFKQGIYSEVNRVNVAFQNKLTVLSIHLSDNEIKELRARWVKMKSIYDYKQINETITDYYKKYKLDE